MIDFNTIAYWLAGAQYADLRKLFALLAVCAFSVDPEEHASRERQPSFTISPETTVVDGPLTPYGTIDYVAYLNDSCSEEVTVENNAAFLLCAALGPGIFSEEVRGRYFDLLGTDPPPMDGAYIVGLRDYAKSADASDTTQLYEELMAQLDDARRRTWTAHEFPELAGWVAINEVPLSIVAGASRRPRYYSPLVSTPVNQLTRVQLPLEQSVMHLSGLLSARASLRLGDNDIDGALDDILCSFRLGRLYSQGPIVIGRLASMALERYAFQTVTILLSSDELNDEQLARLTSEYDALTPLARIDDAIDVVERFHTLNVIQEFLAGRLTLEFEPAPPTGLMARVRFVERAFRNMRMHPDTPLRIANDWYDDLSACAAAPTWREFKSEWEVMDARRTAFTRDHAVQMWFVGLGLWTSEIGRAGGDFFVQQTTPHLGQIGEARFRADARHRLLQIALALARYRSERRQYPQTLAELSPEYLAEIPLDPFTDEPMVYRLNANGYVLYSLCSNLLDDGGVDVSERPTDNDIVLRIEHAR
jgi:hypothetical protein